MTEEKKVVIKINYAANAQKHSSGSHGAAQMVTEWNIKRIVSALTLLILIVIFGIYLWTGRNDKSAMISGPAQSTNQVSAGEANYISETGEEKEKSKEKEIKIEKVAEQTYPAKPEVQEESKGEVTSKQPDKNVSKVVEEPKMEENAASSTMEQQTQKLLAEKKADEDAKMSEQASGERFINNNNIADKEKSKKNLPEELPKGLLRAVITSSIWKKEPADTLTSPIKINRDQALSVFFFTELKGMKGKTVLHQWKHRGKVKFRKKIRVQGDRWRASTSKLMNDSSLGDWTVQLINADELILYQINFKIIDSLKSD